MIFNSDQLKAIDAVHRWFKNPGDHQVFRLFGFAGTGKTTLAKYIVEGISGSAIFCAYTGKAAHVLRKKGCPDVATIHQLIYIPTSRSTERLKELKKALHDTVRYRIAIEKDGASPDNLAKEDAKIAKLNTDIAAEEANVKRPSWKLNLDSRVKQCKLIVVDEASMPDEYMAADLLSFGIPVLALGDPGQLPPVKGNAYFTDVKPDIMLTDVERNAKDSPILYLAQLARQNKSIKVGRYGDSEVVAYKDFNKDWVFEASQVLVGRNDTRKAYNKRMRQLLNHSDVTPEAGDRLVCLKNNHDSGLLNGSLWDVKKSVDTGDGFVYLELKGEEGENVVTNSHACIYEGEAPEYYMRKEADEFDYGYVLTVHKFQGSQSERVLVVDESDVFKGYQNRWLYTAITRAVDSVRIVI